MSRWTRTTVGRASYVTASHFGKARNCPWMFASHGWGFRQGFATNDFPLRCTCSFALDLNTGLGSPIRPLVTHELKVIINHRSGEMLGNLVRRVTGPGNLAHLELVAILFSCIHRVLMLM